MVGPLEGGINHYSATSGIASNFMADKYHQGGNDSGEGRNKASVEIDEANKAMKVGRGGGGGPGSNSVNFSFVHANSLRGDNKTKVGNMVGLEDALIDVEW
ncbi:hypothetical protein KEM55_006488 [Ascosphaera atra]|nr:hypothetical protein KEM55_006488 [Ascosphaera atra]